MQLKLSAAIVFILLFAICPIVTGKVLKYGCSEPLLKISFAVGDGHYSGEVNCGNLFLQSDIPNAPRVKWKEAEEGKFYTLMMLDLDGNAKGSWQDPVFPGENSPVRHWLVGNIPGDLLAGSGYQESARDKESGSKKIAVLQPYRSPHIPVVSDRYGFYLFEQQKEFNFAALSGPVTNFDYASFLKTYKLGDPLAYNFCVAIYTSDSPFSGNAFQGNDVSRLWHQDYGKGKLAP